MIARASTLVLLLLGPALAACLAGRPEFANDLALGAVLAFQIGILARPMARYALLLPLLYAAGAVTAQGSNGVVALIIAVAAAVGASSSQGLHRGLLAMLAAALIGSFEPAGLGIVALRAGVMLAGCAYGLLIAITAGRSVVVPTRAVHPQTALSHAMLLALLTFTAWFAAHLSQLEHGWWLPLAVAAIGEPSISEPVQRAVGKMTVSLIATAPLLLFVDSVPFDAGRAVLTVLLCIVLVTAARSRPSLQMFLFTPVMALLAVRGASGAGGGVTVLNAESAALACTAVIGITVLSKWVLWTLRPDTGRVAA